MELDAMATELWLLLSCEWTKAVEEGGKYQPEPLLKELLSFFFCFLLPICLFLQLTAFCFHRFCNCCLDGVFCFLFLCECVRKKEAEERSAGFFVFFDSAETEPSSQIVALMLTTRKHSAGILLVDTFISSHLLLLQFPFRSQNKDV